MTILKPILAPDTSREGSTTFLLCWHKKPGDTVSRHELIADLSTDKVMLEILAPEAGILVNHLVAAGEAIREKQILCHLKTFHELETDSPSKQANLSLSSKEAPLGRGVPVGVLPNSPSDERLSPSVRQLLAQHCLTADSVKGTGTAGRVTAKDVLEAAAARKKIVHGTQRIPHSHLRMAIAHHTKNSLHTAPHVTSFFECNVDGILAHRATLRAVNKNIPLTAYIIEALVAAVRAAPQINGCWHDTYCEIREEVNVGVGVAVPGDGGVLVPVVHGAQDLPLVEIGSRLSALTVKARRQQLQPEERQGGTITISNHGVTGSLAAAPIVIHQPQVAILGVGRIERRPVVVVEEGQERIDIQSRCFVTLTIDHRVLDGAVADRAMAHFVKKIESYTHAVHFSQAENC